jgi:hypothetical protein
MAPGEPMILGQALIAALRLKTSATSLSGYPHIGAMTKAAKAFGNVFEDE